MTYQQGFPSPPRNTYLEDNLKNVNDSGFKQRLYDAAPNLNLLGLRLGGNDLSGEDKLKAAQLGIDTSAIEGRDLFSFGKWKALDAVKPNERAAQTQLPMAKAVEDRQFSLQQYQLDRQQDLQKDNAKMQFDFGSQLADKQIKGASDLAEKQGKIGMRQLAYSTTMQRQAIPTTWFK